MNLFQRLKPEAKKLLAENIIEFPITFKELQFILENEDYITNLRYRYILNLEGMFPPNTGIWEIFED